MHRERTTTDKSPPRTSPGTPASDLQIPIESDADAGFASRSRRFRTRSNRDEPATPNSIRRRRQRLTSEPPSITPPDRAPLPRHDSSDPPTLNRGYAASLSDAFRHVRASSLSAFGQTSPFRSVRFGDDKPKSQLSITRWFGGASESSTDSEDEEGRQNVSASGHSGDEGQTFGLGLSGSGDDAAIQDSDDEDGLEPITETGGGSVDEKEAEAGVVDGSA